MSGRKDHDDRRAGSERTVHAGRRRHDGGADGACDTHDPTAPLTPASQATSTPPTYEHEVAWASATTAPAAPVVPTSRPRRTGRARWAIGAAVIAVVLATSVAVAALITGQSATSTVLGYVPAGTTAYAEVRLDLPGDQRAAIGAFLSQVPGIRGPGRDRTQARRGARPAGQGRHQRRTDLHGEHQAVVRWRARVQRRPAAARGVGRRTTVRRCSALSRALALVSIKDQAAGPGVVRRGDRQGRRQDDDPDLQRRQLDRLRARRRGHVRLRDVDGKVAVAGDIASVKAAVDTNGSSGFASEPGPKAALDSVKDDYVGFGYVALRPLLDWSNDLNKARGSGLGGVAMEGISDSILKVRPRVDRLLAALREGRHRDGGDCASTGHADRADREPDVDDRRARAVDRHRRGDQP